MQLPVTVLGNLEIEGPSGRTLVLRASGPDLRLTAPQWQDLRQLGPRSLLAQRRWLRAVADSLSRLNISLAIDVAGRSVMRVGDSTNTTVLARLLGLSAVSISFRSAIKLLLTKPSL